MREVTRGMNRGSDVREVAFVKMKPELLPTPFTAFHSDATRGIMRFSGGSHASVFSAGQRERDEIRLMLAVKETRRSPSPLRLPDEIDRQQ